MEPRRLDKLDNASRNASGGLCAVGVTFFVVGSVLVPLLILVAAGSASIAGIAVFAAFTAVWFLWGGTYLVCATYVLDSKPWAIAVGLALATLQIPASIGAIMILGSELPILVLVFIGIVMMSVWMIFQLYRCLALLRGNTRRGFEPLMVQPVPTESVDPAHQDSNAVAAAQR